MSIIESKSSRIRNLNSMPINTSGDYVLYWMTSARRFHYNAGMDRAVNLALKLNKPILVIECMSIRHEWASERILTFSVQGMLDNIKIFRENNKKKI